LRRSRRGAELGQATGVAEPLADAVRWLFIKWDRVGRPFCALERMSDELGRFTGIWSDQAHRHSQYYRGLLRSILDEDEYAQEPDQVDLCPVRGDFCIKLEWPLVANTVEILDVGMAFPHR
jgi:hypothetical protein